MKKVKLSVVSGLMICVILFSSCIGSFAFFNKVLSWNQGVSNEKFVNELVFLGLCIIPVYGICYFADAVVLNSIEFWTGSNPVASTETKSVEGENGTYAVTTGENGYTVTNERNETVDFVYDAQDQSWSVVSGEQTYKLFKMNGEGTVDMYMQNGETMTVPMDESGLLALREAVTGNCFALK